MISSLGQFVKILETLPYFDWRDNRNILSAPDNLEGTTAQWRKLSELFYGKNADKKTAKQIKEQLRADYDKILEEI